LIHEIASKKVIIIIILFRQDKTRYWHRIW
jgi:hypothetical protein